jgi:hypothetical protein
VRFKRALSSGISVWRGDPDCQAAHDEIVAHLRARAANFVHPNEAAENRRKGNLGEHIAFRIGDATDFSGWERLIKNASEPLVNISTSGVDIVWAFLSSRDPSEDLVVFQETKTTADLSLDYAYSLVSDYRKLSLRNPASNLGTRLQGLANYLEYSRSVDESIVHRIIAMGALDPRRATKVRLVPTLMHDSGVDSVAKLLAVRASICAFGWNQANVTPWSIVLSDLGERLERIAHGTH